MSEYADKHSKASRKERVDRILQVDPKAKIDASGYEPPGPMDTGKKTEQAQERPTRKSGGRLDGGKAHQHAGRKKRDSGGAASVINQLRPQVPTGGLYGNGFSPTHAGMMSTAAGLKKGGMAKKRADGGEADQGYFSGAPADASHAHIIKSLKQHGMEHVYKKGVLHAMEPNAPETATPIGNNVKKLRDWLGYARGGAVQRTDGTSRAEWRKEKQHSDIAGKEAALPKSNPVMASTGTRETGGRQPRADGGRTKGKTNINIIIGGPKEMPAAGPMAPPPPSAMPPKPPLPPAAMGGPTAAPPGMPPGMPPQMPPGMGPK